MSRFRAHPYAKALFAVIDAGDSVRRAEVAGELDRIATALKEVPELQRVLVTPTVPTEGKTAILDKVLDALAVAEPTRRFVHVVQHHYRTEHMADIAAAYRLQVDQAEGRTRARVETAVALDDQQRTKLLTAVSSVVGTDVIADFSTRPDLLAGFRLQVGSQVFDGSLAGELDRLSRQIEIEQG